MQFEFEIEEKDNYSVILPKGRLMDENQASELMEEINSLLDDEMPNFILDFSNLEYLNSTGLSIFIRIFTKSRKAGGETVVCNLSNKIKELFLITKLNTIFTVTGSLNEAAEIFKNKK